MKANVLLILFISAGLNVLAQKGVKNLPANEPIPQEFINKSKEIYFNKNIEFIDSEKQIYTTYGSSFVVHALIENQVEIKEEEVSKEKIFENDTIRIPEIMLKKYEDLFSKGNIEFAESKEKSSHTLTIKVFDHGFHWATSSAAGVFIRTKAELISSDGTTIWEQYYTMDKNEAKVPYNCKAINMNKAIDKLIDSFEENPDLLVTTYEQITGFLAAKILSSDK